MSLGLLKLLRVLSINSSRCEVQIFISPDPFSRDFSLMFIPFMKMCFVIFQICNSDVMDNLESGFFQVPPHVHCGPSLRRCRCTSARCDYLDGSGIILLSYFVEILRNSVITNTIEKIFKQKQVGTKKLSPLIADCYPNNSGMYVIHKTNNPHVNNSTAYHHNCKRLLQITSQFAAAEKKASGKKEIIEKASSQR